MLKLVLFSTFLLSFCLHAEELKLKLDSVKYTLGMSGDFVDSNNIKARVLSLDAGLKVKDALSESVFYHAHIIGNFENGTNKATGLTAEYEPNQAVNLWEGGVVYHPVNFLKFELGAIQQNHYQSPLLVWNTAFAGATEEISMGHFYLKAQQAIPNNNILSRRIGGIDEGTPLFFMETLGVRFQDDHFKLRAEASRFSFKDLSSQVALTSQDFGNSVIGSNLSARFLYQYKGTNLSADSTYTFSNGYSLLLNGQYLFNEGAPNKRNTGYLGEAGIGFEGVFIKFGQFRNESDTAPAFYNARVFGHNNMKGSVISLIGNTKNYLFRLQAVKGQTIDSNIRQSNLNIINFAIVRNYEL